MTKGIFPIKSVCDTSQTHRKAICLTQPPPQGTPFPKDFRDTVRTIFRRLFRVYAHLYSNHFDQICALGIEGLWTRWFVYLELIVALAHLNTSYRHFFLFVHQVRRDKTLF